MASQLEPEEGLDVGSWQRRSLMGQLCVLSPTTWVAKGLGFVWEEPLRRKDITWAVPLDSARVPCWIEEVRSGYDTGWWVMTATLSVSSIRLSTMSECPP